MTAIIICGTTCLVMISGVLFVPQIKIGKLSLDSYWVVVVTGMLALFVSGQAKFATVGKALLANTAINPIKILILFISMTILSIFLDELGFFSYLANEAMKRARASQMRMFLYLYLTVSVLTVFTSNDIIILSFTPFICYFAKNAKIDPMPYLIAEFIAANTWSMALIIGNPTNIYLATAYNIDFMKYAHVMLLPTTFSGIAAFAVLLLLFRRKLSVPMTRNIENIRIEDKTLLFVGIIHLAVCTVVLAIGSYIGIEMWLVSLFSAISLFVCVTIIGIIRRKKPVMLIACVKRAPWQLIPFVISMFVMILVLSGKGVTGFISRILGNDMVVVKYGLASFLSANIINNIPMSVLFSSIIKSLSGAAQIKAVYSAIVGSNIGAFLTPIGALAGIMWTSILKIRGIKVSFTDFVKSGVIVSVPTILAALVVLTVTLH